MLIIGEKEMNDHQVSVRKQGKGDAGVQDVETFIRDIKSEIKQRS
jgi:threonyl-tRNA synthetase